MCSHLSKLPFIRLGVMKNNVASQQIFQTELISRGVNAFANSAFVQMLGFYACNV